MMLDVGQGKQDSPDISRVGDLEIRQDLAFQRTSWKAQRVGWIVMAILLLTALLGVFGQGLFSYGTAGNPSGLWVEYERFGHWEATSSLRIHIGPAEALSGVVRFSVDQEYLSKVQIEGMTPEPDMTEASAAAVTYEFRTPDANQQAIITMHMKMKRFGVFVAKVQAGDQPPVYFRQVIYP